MIWRAFGVNTLLLLVALSPAARGGVFTRTVDCTQEVTDFCAQGNDENNALLGPFAIVHPPGYTGAQAVLSVDVCTSPSAMPLSGAIQRAVQKWNTPTIAIGNCQTPCSLPEDPLPGGVFDAESALLHELGHALGLGHPNLVFDDPESAGQGLIQTSYSAAYDGANTGVLVGSDLLRGSKDDFFDDLSGSTAVNVTWFREDNNDPFAIDGATIDIDNYSRATSSELPTGSAWATNANYCHAWQLGLNATQSVMYGVASALTKFSALAADDGNMLKMQQTGEDRAAGTLDDYVLAFSWVPNCVDAEIEVGFLFMDPGDVAATSVDVLPTFPAPPPPLARHYTAKPFVGDTRILIDLNSRLIWDYGEPVVLADGFESGGFDAWTEVSPFQRKSGVTDIRGDDHPYGCPVGPPPF